MDTADRAVQEANDAMMGQLSSGSGAQQTSNKPGQRFAFRETLNEQRLALTNPLFKRPGTTFIGELPLGEWTLLQITRDDGSMNLVVVERNGYHAPLAVTMRGLVPLVA
jgi:hypothetical protein